MQDNLKEKSLLLQKFIYDSLCSSSMILFEYRRIQNYKKSLAKVSLAKVASFLHSTQEKDNKLKEVTDSEKTLQQELKQS